jgi:hypothetical protein
MQGGNSGGSQSLFRRLGIFLSDFAPGSPLQLLFPLGSFILLAGMSVSWLPPNHTVYDPYYQTPRPNLWFDVSTPALQIRYYAALWLIRLAFLASIALWCLRVRDVTRKFVVCVFLPFGLGVGYFLTLVLLGQSSAESVLEPTSQVLWNGLGKFPARLGSLGWGFYIAMLGAAVLSVGLWTVRSELSSLPFRFGNTGASPHETPADSRLGRDVFVFLIVTSIVTTILLTIGEVVLLDVYQARLPWISNWPHNFSIIQWLPELFAATLAAAFAILVWGVRPGEKSGGQIPLSRGCAIGLLIPLAIIIVPRFLAIIASHLTGLVFAEDWDELLLPHPLVWPLIAFLIGFLYEFVLRRCLLAALSRTFGLKRAILLVALLWWLLPLYYEIASVPRLRIGAPGVLLLPPIHASIYVVYSIPLGWLYARTKSVIPGTVMLGTVMLYHEGIGHLIYPTHPALFWTELAGWLLAGWFLFNRLPRRYAIAVLPTAGTKEQ